MSGVMEHCYEVGLRINHTNWWCCTLDYDSEFGPKMHWKTRN